jgi:hypothetical protein
MINNYLMPTQMANAMSDFFKYVCMQYTEVRPTSDQVTK